MSNYPNLPGVNVNVKDGQLSLTNSTNTNNVLIIAEVKAPASITVPQEPVLVLNEDTLRQNFGSFFFKGELNPIAAEWKIARDNGFGNIYLLALEGETDKEKFINLQEQFFGILADLSISHVVLSSLYADVDIEGLTGVDFGTDDLSEVEGLEVKHVRRAVTSPAITLEETSTITFHSKGNDVTATIPESMSEAKEVIALIEKEINTGSAELGMELEISLALESGKVVLKSNDEFEVEGAELLTALGLDSVENEIEGYGNPAVLLADFAEKQNRESGNMLAYIGTSAPKSTSLTDIKNKVEKLAARKNQISKYLQVVAGPEIGISVPGSLRTQWVSGVTQYAATVNRLEPQVATTNQTLAGASSLRYNLSLRQLDTLVGSRYVTFRVKNNRIVVVDGVTTAPDLFVGEDVVHSDFVRLSTLRITSYMIDAVRSSCDPYIGQPNEFHIYTAMNTTVKGVIRDAITRGIIQDANYSITLGDTLDSSIINLTILPQFELRTINISVGLSTPENFEGTATP